ncbi:MAG: VOC family protein [Xanthomonadales bacterium]|nr:VOC family protein [Xanthomonadales bacterium]
MSTPPQLFQFALLVRDYDEAIAWYTRALGWRLIEDTSLTPEKRWVVIGVPGAMQVLLARAATEAQAAHIGRQGGGRVWLFLRSTDFDADCARLAAAGARFDGAPRSETYGQVVVFEDLYGNRWDLIGPTRGS